MFKGLVADNFDVATLHHAEAIIKHDLPKAEAELEAVLKDIRVPVEELVRGGGGEGELTQRIRRALAEGHGWDKHSFVVKKIVDDVERESTTHVIDHVKRFEGGTIALEIEWNNKDPFFDRDLENFKRLHADGAIAVGAIITRGRSLHQALRPAIERFAMNRSLNGIDKLRTYYSPTQRQQKMIEAAAAREGSFERGWAHVFVSDKFGEATTHWTKLEERVGRGVGNPCPLLLIGVPSSVLVD